MSRVPLAFVLALSSAAAAAAEVRPLPLALHPPANAARALQYALLPELRDAIPGNAVTHYRRAVEFMKQDLPPARDWYADLERWMTAPLKDFPREEVGHLLKQGERTLAELDAGARSEQCDWGLTEKLRLTGVSTLLPDVEMRKAANLVMLRARYELAMGRPGQSVRTTRTGFAMARHVARLPTLICALVGIAIASVMEDRLEELIEQPDAPNLYWPLTDLPRPFIDLREPMEGERLMSYGTFPGMAETAADLNAGPWTPEQAVRSANLRALLSEEHLPLPDAVNTAVLAWRVLARHEAAKKRLVAQGRPKDLVDAMPHLQVAMLDAFLLYDELFDDSAKWQSLPLREALPAMKRAEERRAKTFEDKNGPAIPIARLLLPAVRKVVSARARIDRRLAALRCVEAVRLYAADHDGKLPASLDDITDAPAPPDPVTGKPFDYRVVGDHALFGCAPFTGAPADNANTPTYELRMER